MRVQLHCWYISDRENDKLWNIPSEMMSEVSVNIPQASEGDMGSKDSADFSGVITILSICSLILG